MIQRIQSLYLLGVFACSVFLFFTAIAAVATTQHLYNFSVWGLVDITDKSYSLVLNTLPLLLANGVVALLSLVIIFSFKNRSLQTRLSRLLLLLLATFVAGTFFYFENSLSKIDATENLQQANSKKVDYALGSILPLIAIVFAVMAIRSIKNDEELVRSADRIR